MQDRYQNHLVEIQAVLIGLRKKPQRNGFHSQNYLRKQIKSFNQDLLKGHLFNSNASKVLTRVYEAEDTESDSGNYRRRNHALGRPSSQLGYY